MDNGGGLTFVVSNFENGLGDFSLTCPFSSQAYRQQELS